MWESYGSSNDCYGDLHGARRAIRSDMKLTCGFWQKYPVFMSANDHARSPKLQNGPWPHFYFKSLRVLAEVYRHPLALKGCRFRSATAPTQ